MSNRRSIVEEYIKAKGMTKAEFCRLCGVSWGTLERFMSGSMKMYISNIVKIVLTLGVSVADVLGR